MQVATPPIAESEVRTGRTLLRATLPFASEHRGRSWWYLASTVTLLFAALIGAGAAPWWPLQLLLAPVAALLLVRAFILFHDFMHGAILQDSLVARGIFYALGALVLVPPRSWKYSHNYHHAHVGQLEASSVGSFPIMTVEAWQRADWKQRLGYRIARNPIIIATASATVFFWSVCVQRFLSNPRRYWDAMVVVAVQAALITGLTLMFSANVMFFGLLLPQVLAAIVGAYLFYAQHNCPGLDILPNDEWCFDEAALRSSSFMKLSPVMHWFTGNIGYHHVHHLNPAVPFYRLPEAMAAVTELQHPVTTTLRLRDILGSLRLKLWDPARHRMVSFREAAQGAQAAPSA